MGYLKEGVPLSFTDSLPHLKHVRRSGIEQFINHYLRSRRAHTPAFLWGDEVEYGVFSRTSAADDIEGTAGGQDGGSSDVLDEEENWMSSERERASSSAGMTVLSAVPIGLEHLDITPTPPTAPASALTTSSASITSGRSRSASCVNRSGKYDLSLRGAEIRKYLAGIEVKAMEPIEAKAAAEGRILDLDIAKEGELACLWAPEYGAWMVEAVPAAPYGGYVEDLLLTEQSMKMRRQRIHMALHKGEIAPSMVNFPMLGVEGYDHFSGRDRVEPYTNSDYVRDQVINPHPRFGALTRNIRIRRGSNVNVVGHIDRDIPTTVAAAEGSGKKDEGVVHMDAMAFGMGCCCLQVTMQSEDEDESRFLHDQLATFAPYFLAHSAASPIFRGTLLDTDTRWEFIGMSVDCRTDAERSVEGADMTPSPFLAGGGVKPIRNSRYSNVSRYIGKPHHEEDRIAIEKLNDLSAVIDEELFDIVQQRGVDPMLAQHLAHIFARDPLVIFDDGIDMDNDSVLDHFDNLQSTNWRTMRWKPPSLPVGFEAQRRQKILDAMVAVAAQEEGNKDFSASAGASADASSPDMPTSPTDEEWFQQNLGSFGPGWRIEFRPLEVSLTDFENASYSIMIVLLTRAILAHGYNFYMPMSVVEENLQRSKVKDACLNQKFFIRKDAFVAGPGLKSVNLVPDGEIELLELTIDELFNGTKAAAAGGESKREIVGFLGFIPAVWHYLDSIGTPESVKEKLSAYMTLLRRRASGELPTTARWMRNFVESHSLYKGDGHISSCINDDLCKHCDDIGMGIIQCPDLVGDIKIDCLVCLTPEQSAPFMDTNKAQVLNMNRSCREKKLREGIESTDVGVGAVGVGPSEHFSGRNRISLAGSVGGASGFGSAENLSSMGVAPATDPDKTYLLSQLMI